MKKEITEKTIVCGVIGDPIGHTLSPVVHSELAEAMGLDLIYLPFHVKPENLGDSIKGAYGLGIRCMNVTIPHKQAVMEHLAFVDEAAGAIGAVNTIVRREEGYYGYNTDLTGLDRALQEEQIRLAGADVIMLGAGGVANAAAYLCGSRQARSVTILNRTRSRGERLAAVMGGQFPNTVYRSGAIEDWKSLKGREYVCIQTTSLGMYPDTEAAVVTDPAFYEKLSAAADLIYRPEKTRYIRLAEQAGVKSCGGLLMFLYQAVAAFEYFTGVTPSEEAVDRAKKKLKGILRE